VTQHTVCDSYTPDSTKTAGFVSGNCPPPLNFHPPPHRKLYKFLKSKKCTPWCHTCNPRSIGFPWFVTRNAVRDSKHSAWLIQYMTKYTVHDSINSSWLIYSGLNVIFSEPHLHLRCSSTPWLNIQFVTHIRSAWLNYFVSQYTVRDSETLEFNAIYQRNPIYIYKHSHSSWINIQFVTHRWLIVRDSIYSS